MSEMVTRSGEPPLSAFLSSILNDEYLWARQAAEEVLCSKGWTPWAFERTPAGSEELEEGYLRKVREADVVVWLCGRETTLPVAKEIRTAIDHNRRILILRITPDRSDGTTEDLIRDVGTKYQTACDAASLKQSLSAALDDETARAFRGVARASRVVILRQRRKESRGRCVARWCAAGVPDKLAFEMADDPRTGAAPVALDVTSRLQLLTGEIGSGKSLFAERLLQASIDALLEGTSREIPLYLEARSSPRLSTERVLELAEPIGSLDEDGCLVILDGLDEIGAAAVALIDDARRLVYTHPNVRVVVVARPVPSILGEFARHVVRIPLLEIGDAVALVNRVSGRTDELVTPSWPESLSEAVRRPLFAILFAVTRSQRGDSWPTRAELVHALVEQSLGRAQARRESADPLLRRLAVRAVDSGNSLVPASEVGPYAELAPLLESRLVMSRDDSVGFPLVIFAEWFAARSVLDGDPAVTEICEDRERVRRWLPAFELSVSAASSFTDASRVLGPVCSRHPALASQLTQRAFPDATPLNEHWDWRQLGDEVRAATEQWAAGLGRLAPVVGHVSDDGKACSVGIRISTDRSLIVAWFRPGQGDRPVTELPIDFQEAPHGRYLTWRWGAPRGRAWAWRWAFETLRDGLKRELDRCGLPAPPSLDAEYLWQAASSIIGRNTSAQGPISVAELVNRLRHYPVGGIVRTSGGLSFESSTMRDAVGRLSGEELQPPWPGPDEQGGSYVWSGFRPPTLLARAEAVYLAALNGYSELVDIWFQRLKPELRFGSRMPVSVVGIVKPVEPGPFGEPAILWRVQPDVQAEYTTVSFQLADAADWPRVRSDFHRLSEERGGGYTESLLDIFGFDAARRLAYSWLRDDLRDVDWY